MIARLLLSAALMILCFNIDDVSVGASLNTKSFTPVFDPYSGLSVCAVDPPSAVLSLADVSVGVPSDVPETVLCSLSCTGYSGCTSFNYRQQQIAPSRCELYTYLLKNCSTTTSATCQHYQVTGLLPPSCRFPVLVQQQFNGSTTFNRGWNDFKNGFGNFSTDYWIGNDMLHLLTSSGQYSVRFDLQAQLNSQWYWAEYSNFTVDSEANKYKVTFGGYRGTAGDSFTWHNGYGFATSDRVDQWGCATGTYGNSGGYWYHNCAKANINGSPWLYSTNGVEGFLWDQLPVGSQRGDKKLMTSKMWLI